MALLGLSGLSIILLRYEMRTIIYCLVPERQSTFAGVKYILVVPVASNLQ